MIFPINADDLSYSNSELSEKMTVLLEIDESLIYSRFAISPLALGPNPKRCFQ